MQIRHSIAALMLTASLTALPLQGALAADTATIAKGTVVNAKIEQTLDSSNAHVGDKFVLDLEPGWFKNKSVKGSKLEGHVDAVQPAAKFHKKGSLSLVIDDMVTPDGNTVPAQAEVTSSVKPQGHKLRDAALIVGGAVVGHHMAKKAGKKHGALLGAAAGAAAVFALPGGNVKIPAGSTLKVRFDAPVDLNAKS